VLGAEDVTRPLADDDAGGHRVAGRDAGHHRRVGDPQMGHPVDGQVAVDDRVPAPAHGVGAERGVLLRSLREGVDTSTATGRMVLGIFASLAEYERTLIAERAAAAREAARSRGRQVGRPPALTAEQVALAQRMRAHGESVTTICTTLKVGRSTLYRHLA